MTATNTINIRHLLLLCACLSCLAGAATAQSTRPAATTEPASKFLRFVPSAGANGGQLQASVVTYRNAQGATVDLIAAVHIADARFYHELAAGFPQYDSLLYEMVKPKDYDPRHPASLPATRPGQATSRPQRRARSGSLAWVGILQRFMKDKLALSFQLEEIDYSQPNFVHADLNAETFQEMQQERGESMMGLMLQQMFREMARDMSGETRGAQPNMAEIIMALQKPDRERQIKLVLAKQFGMIDEMMAGMEGPNGSVILSERNKAAIEVLKQRLAAGDKKLGIFYGAAHLKGMEKILTQEMGFEQVGEPHWRTAWDMPAPATTLPATAPSAQISGSHEFAP